MPEPIPTMLQKDAGLTLEQAKIIALYIDDLDVRPSAEARALFMTKRPGQDAEIRSVRGRNLLINWKGLLKAGASALAATVGAVGGGPIGFGVAVSLALTALAALAPANSITLGDDHTRVVTALWSGNNEDAEDVAFAGLAEELDGKMTPQRLEEILDELAELDILEFREDGARIVKHEHLFAVP